MFSLKTSRWKSENINRPTVPLNPCLVVGQTLPADLLRSLHQLQSPQPEARIVVVLICRDSSFRFHISATISKASFLPPSPQLFICQATLVKMFPSGTPRDAPVEERTHLPHRVLQKHSKTVEPVGQGPASAISL